MSGQAPRPRRPSGGAYLTALLALTVLSAIGLTLAGITATEREIGVNEGVVQRTHYSAAAGLDSSVARALALGDYSAARLTLEGSGPAAAAEPGLIVESSPFYPIHESPCDLCRVDAAGSYDEPRFHRVRFAVTATARPAVEGGPRSQTRRSVTTLIDVEPWSVPAAAYAPLSEPRQLAAIRF